MQVDILKEYILTFNSTISVPSSQPPNNSNSNLNCRVGGEGSRGEEPPTPISVVSSFSDEITNALASRNPIFSEVSSPPWSKQNDNNQTDTTTIDDISIKKSDLTLDLSSNAHCERVPFKTSPVMTPSGVLKLPTLTVPTSSITGAPATWNIHNCNDGKIMTKTEVLVTATQNEPERRRLPSENAMNNGSVRYKQEEISPPDIYRAVPNGGYAQSDGDGIGKVSNVALINNESRHKLTSVSSIPVSPRSCDQQSKDSSSIAGEFFSMVKLL